MLDAVAALGPGGPDPPQTNPGSLNKMVCQLHLGQPGASLTEIGRRARAVLRSFSFAHPAREDSHSLIAAETSTICLERHFPLLPVRSLRGLASGAAGWPLNIGPGQNVGSPSIEFHRRNRQQQRHLGAQDDEKLIHHI
jgi:hypothetical protein